jgi:hypothetical protein
MIFRPSDFTASSPGMALERTDASSSVRVAFASFAAQPAAGSSERRVSSI